MRSPFSDASLVEWLERQPADAGYNWGDSGNCALCQYFRAMGFPVGACTAFWWVEKDGTKHMLPRGWNEIVMPHNTTRFQLFRDVVKRARAALLRGSNK